MFVPLCRLSGHGADVTRGRVAPDSSSIATGSADKSLIMWDSSTGKPLRSLQAHPYEVTDLSYHGSSMGLLTSSLDGYVRLFDLRSASSTAATVFPSTTRSDGLEFASLAAGTSLNSPVVAAGSSSGRIQMFDIRKGNLCVSTFAHYNAVCSLEMSQDDSMVLSSSLDGTIRLWSAYRGDCLMTVTDEKSNPAPCVYAGFTHDKGGFIGLFLDSSIRRWVLTNRIHSQGRVGGPTMTNSTKTFTRVCNGGIAVPSEDGFVHFVDPVSGKVLQPATKAHADDVLSVDCRGDLLISTGAGEDSSAVLWVKTDEKLNDNSITYNLVSPQIEGLV